LQDYDSKIVIGEGRTTIGGFACLVCPTYRLFAIDSGV
jgi:hypothetical protein